MSTDPHLPTPGEPVGPGPAPGPEPGTGAEPRHEPAPARAPQPTPAASSPGSAGNETTGGDPPAAAPGAGGAGGGDSPEETTTGGTGGTGGGGGDGGGGGGRRPHGQHPGEEFFGRIRSLGIVRPDEDRWAAGVCAALARRTGLDPLLMRGLFVALAIVGGFGLLLYGIGWLLLPHPDGRIHAEGVLRGVVSAGFVGAVISILFGLGWTNHHWAGPGGWPWFPPAGLTLTVLVAAGIWWLVTRRDSPPGQSGTGSPAPPPPAATGSPPYPAPTPARPAPTPAYGTPAYGTPAYGTPAYGSPAYGTPGHGGGPAPRGSATGLVDAPAAPGSTAPGTAAGPPARPPAPWAPGPAARPPDVHAPSHALTRATLGLALVAAALTLLWHRLGGPPHDHPVVVAVAVALGVVAIGVIVAGLLGRRSGGLAPIAIILAIAALNAAVVAASTTTAVGAHTWRPTGAAVAEQGYDLGAGEATVDLSDPALTVGRTSATPLMVPVHVGLGRLHVIVPGTTAAQVRASVGAGNIHDAVDPNGSPPSGSVAGTGLERTVDSGTGPVLLVVTASVGLGEIEIDTQGVGVAS